jgi:4-amino-4-deoxy-L-arabinose transferase-like glycosyltransferase
MHGALKGEGAPAGAGGKPWAAARPGRDGFLLALLILGALALRAWLGFRDQIIFNDGPQFIDIARAFVAGDADRAMSHVYHPLYSWLIAQAFPLFGDYERAALAVAALAGALVGLPLWGLLRRLFGRRVAWTGVILWAVHPYAVKYAANVQSDSIYLFFFLVAVLFLWRGLGELPALRGTAMFALAGIFSALAYLTRPEGVGVVVLGGVWLIAGLASRTRTRWRREIGARLVAGVVLLAGFTVPAFPYLKHIHDTTGVWQITQKKSLARLTGVGKFRRPQWAHDRVKAEVTREYGRPPRRSDSTFTKYGVRGYKLIVTFAEALTWVLVPFLLLGLAVRGRALWRTQGDRFLLSFFALYGLVVYRLAVTLGSASKRHVIALAILGLGWVSLGVVSLAPRLEAALRARGVRWARRAGTLLLAALVIAALPKTLAINAGERLGEKQAGRWIRDHAAAGREPVVFAPRSRIAYYAGARYLPVPLRFRYDAAIAYLRDYGVDYVVTSDVMTPKWYPDFLERISPKDLRLEATFADRPGSDHHYDVYRILYPEGRPRRIPPPPRRMWRGEEPP